MAPRKFSLMLCLLACTAGLWSAPSEAKRIAIDFGPNFDGDIASGQNFGTGTDCAEGSTAAESCLISVAGDQSTGAIKLGFTVNFGDGNTYDSLFISENGVLSFGSAVDATIHATLADIGHPVIAPFYTNLTSVTPDAEDTPFTLQGGDNAGELMYARGVADPYADSAGAYSLAEAVPAFHAAWYGPTAPDGTQIYMQVLLYSQGTNGDFDLRLRYGTQDTDSYSASGALAGFVLGPNTASLPDPLLASDDYVYQFRDGLLVTSEPPPADTDGDGVLDSTDNCPNVANANQSDSDHDGVGDACDNCKRKANSDQTDGDADGVGNVCDNCPTTANANQADSNHNGIGNACEAPPPKRCDVDGDSDIDAKDIDAILHALRKPASSPTDPRDADGNGVITLIDAAKCISRCTRKLCKS